MEYPLLSVGKVRPVAAQFPSGAGDGHALAGTHANEIGLELGEGGEAIEEQLSQRIARGVERPAESRFHASFPMLVGDGADTQDQPRQRLPEGLQHPLHSCFGLWR